MPINQLLLPTLKCNSSIWPLSRGPLITLIIPSLVNWSNIYCMHLKHVSKGLEYTMMYLEGLIKSLQLYLRWCTKKHLVKSFFFVNYYFQYFWVVNQHVIGISSSQTLIFFCKPCMTWTKNAGVYIINKQFMQKSWKVVLKYLFSCYSAAEMIYVNWSYLIFCFCFSGGCR